jgi:hypothetical protein
VHGAPARPLDQTIRSDGSLLRKIERLTQTPVLFNERSSRVLNGVAGRIEPLKKVCCSSLHKLSKSSSRLGKTAAKIISKVLKHPSQLIELWGED